MLAAWLVLAVGRRSVAGLEGAAAGWCSASTAWPRPFLPSASSSAPILPHPWRQAKRVFLLLFIPVASISASALVKAETNEDGGVGEVLARWLVSS